MPTLGVTFTGNAAQLNAAYQQIGSEAGRLANKIATAMNTAANVSTRAGTETYASLKKSEQALADHVTALEKAGKWSMEYRDALSAVRRELVDLEKAEVAAGDAAIEAARKRLLAAKPLSAGQSYHAAAAIERQAQYEAMFGKSSHSYTDDEAALRRVQEERYQQMFKGSGHSYTDAAGIEASVIRDKRRADALAAFGGPIALNEKQNAYLAKKRAMGMGGGSGMAPGFAKLLATESAIIGGQGGAAAATGWFANFANNLKGHGSGGMQQLIHVGRATFDSLASGMSPWRVMMQQAPQALQAFASMTGSALTKLMGVIFNPITIGVAAAVGAIAAGGYFIYRYFSNLSAGLENVGEKFGVARASMSELREEMVKSGDAARDFTKWMHSLAGATLSVADKTDILLKRLREQFQLEMEIAKMKGASPQKLLGMELDQLQKEQDVVNRARELAYEKKAIHEKEARDAEAAIKNSASDRIAIGKAEAESGMAAKFGDAIREKLNIGSMERALEIGGKDSTFTRREFVGQGMNGEEIYTESEVRYADALDGLKNTIVDIDVDGKHFHGSLAQAQREMEGYNATAEKLKKVQADLAEILAKKQALTQQDVDSIRNLSHQEADLISAINLKNQFGPTIAAGGGAAGSRDLTANQRIGAYAMPGQTTMIDLTRQIVAQTKITNEKLDKIVNHPGGDTSGYGS